MRVAVVIAPRDFRDETLSALRLLLGKWDVDVSVSSYTSSECVGYHGAVCKPDLNTAKVKPSDYDALILVDGIGVEKYKLYDFRPLLDLVKTFHDSKKLVVGIGNGMRIIARANIVANRKLALPPDQETKRMVELYKGTISENEIETDSNIMTLGNSDKTPELVNVLLGQLGVK